MIDWIDVETKPELNKPILIHYLKGKQSCVTEGYLIDKAVQCAKETHPVEFWRSVGYGLVFMDYADRQLESLTAKKSKNKVTHWAPKVNRP